MQDVLKAGARTAVLIAAHAASLLAQEPALPLTLEDAIAKGLANSPRLTEAEARRDGNEAAVRGREAERLPIVSVLGGYTRTNHVQEFSIAQPGQPTRVLYPDVPDNPRARFDLQWPIYTGGRTAALERAARAERDASVEEIAAARADLRLEITRAFWALVTARETERVLTRSLDAVDAHVFELRARLDQGLIPPNELLSAEAQQSRQRLLAVDAASTRRIAEADMRRLLGFDGTGAIEPRAALAPEERQPAGVEPLLEAARTQRPERRVFSDRVESARARTDAAAAAALPQVAVNAGYDYARPNPRIFPRVAEWEDSWDVSVNVSWTVWDGGRVRAERAGAAAAARAAEARAAEFDRQLSLEVQQRRLELESSQAAIAVAEAGLRAAAEARRVLGERFNAGVATSTEVLDAQTDVLVADLERTRALANAKLAEARLARAIGQEGIR